MSALAHPAVANVAVATMAVADVAFANESWAWVAAVIGATAVVVLILGYRNSPLRGGPRAAAMTLKILGFFLLALALLEPVHLDEEPKKNANDLGVLADNSAGLAVPLSADAPAPSDELRAALAGPEPGRYPAWLEELDDTFRLQTFLFDRGLRRTDDFSSELAFDRSRSDLVSSLQGLRERFRNRPLAAAIVLTDGNATDAGELDAFLESVEEEEKPAPVYPVVVGRSDPSARDLAILRVDAETTQFEDARVTLHVEAMARGEMDEPAELFVTNEQGEELETRQVAFPPGPGERTRSVRLRLGAIPPGISFLDVGIRPAGEDEMAQLTERNDSRSVAVDRGRGPYRVLYVSGRPNWEYKFLRRAVARDAELDLVGLIRIARREPKFEWRGRSGESSNPLFRGFRGDTAVDEQKYDQPVMIRLNTESPEELRDGFPRTAEALFPRYRAIVLDDVEAEFFTREQQNLIERFASRRGGAVVMLGGQESFRPGGWDDTPVGRLLPVYLDRVAEGGPAMDATFDLTREGWLEPWMRLRAGKQEETKRLAYMPPFFAVNRIDAIKPGASLLATVRDGEDRTLPAVVTQRYGEGRSAAVTVADFWRWAMKDAELQDDLAKSWRQLLRWAVNDAPARVEMEKEEIDEGAVPLTRLSVRVRDEAFDPQDDVSVSLEVTDRNGETSPLSAEPSLEEPGLFTADYAPGNGEGYRIAATVYDGEGEEIGGDEVARALNPDAEEFARLGPDRERLERIAEASGGEVLELSELSRLPAMLADLDLPVSEIRQRPLWHTPWLFLLALACFLGEWIIRRRQGIL